MAGVPMVAEWQLLYNRYHRKPELYQMQLKHVDLTRNKVACAPFGGPIVPIRDDAKIVQLFAESTIRKLRNLGLGLLLPIYNWRRPKIQ